MPKRDFQSRLASHLNRINKRLTDNAIEWLGTLQDCLHITIKKNAMGDIDSRIIEDYSLVSVIFPQLKDVPVQIKKTAEGNLVAIPYSFELQSFLEVYMPIEHKIKTDDLIVRVFWDTDLNKPIVWVFQVKDVLKSFGNHSVLFNKYILTFYDEVLPDSVIADIIKMVERRNILTW